MITRTGVHAINALTVLARLPEERCVGAVAVAAQIGAPPNYLGKLLQKLGGRGLVESRRGFGGGFRLARRAESIRLIDVIEPIEQISRWTGCFLGRPTCSDATPCAVHHRWARARDAYLDLLSRTTIADLVSGAGAERPAPQQDDQASWVGKARHQHARIGCMNAFRKEGPTMSAIQVLMDEHRVIEQVLACLAKMAERCQREGRLDAEPARDAVEFFRNFADRCHHGKEEQKLFPMMESRGFSPLAGPTAVMRQEHERGRELLGEMRAAIDGAAAGQPREVVDFVRAASSYAQFLHEHIHKEDHVLFPMAERMLGPNALDELAESFDRVEREEVGEGVHDSWLKRANALADHFGVERAGRHRPSCGCGEHP